MRRVRSRDDFFLYICRSCALVRSQLYALRESDRSAMKLYIVLALASLPLDLGAVGSAQGFVTKLLSLVALALKAALLYPAVRAHDVLPAARPEKTLLAAENRQQLHVKVQETVAAALREELERLEWESRSKPAATRAPAQPSQPMSSQLHEPPSQPREAPKEAHCRSAPSSVPVSAAPSATAATTSSPAASAAPPRTAAASASGAGRGGGARKGGGGGDATWDEV